MVFFENINLPYTNKFATKKDGGKRPNGEFEGLPARFFAPVGQIDKTKTRGSKKKSHQSRPQGSAFQIVAPLRCFLNSATIRNPNRQNESKSQILFDSATKIENKQGVQHLWPLQIHYMCVYKYVYIYIYSHAYIYK